MKPSKRDIPGPGDGIAPGELERLVSDGRAGTRDLLGMLRMVRVDSHPAASPAQLRALQAHEPHRAANLVALRQALASGPLRVGPLAEDDAEELAGRFAALGLACRVTGLSADDERAF